MRIAPTIELTPAEESKLQRNSRARNAPVRLKERARIILLAAEGLENCEIAERLGQDPGKVGRWRNRYAELGLEGILKDKTRPRAHRAPFAGQAFGNHQTDAQLQACGSNALEPEHHGA